MGRLTIVVFCCVALVRMTRFAMTTAVACAIASILASLIIRPQLWSRASARCTWSNTERSGRH
eukprot:1805137-Pyramimonas_sp.AAC.1